MITELLKKCGNTRRFSSREIFKDDIEYMLDAGRIYISRWASCFTNASATAEDKASAEEEGIQDTVTIEAINDKKLIGELARCCHNGRWLEGASLLFVLCTKRMDNDDLFVEKYRLGKLKDELYDMDPNVLDILNARQHIALSAANIIALTAGMKGMAFNIISCFDVYKASRVLKMPNSHLVSYMIALGFSDDTLKLSEEK